MKTLVIFRIFLVFSVLFSVPGHAQTADNFCGFDPITDGDFEYPFGNRAETQEINAKFILVAFPAVDEESYEIPNIFEYDVYQPLLEEMDYLLWEQSQGKLKLSSSSGFVFPPEEGWSGSGSSSTSWYAQLPARLYNNFGDNEIPPSYIADWSGPEHDISQWWDSFHESEFATHLFAEIFWKIKNDYTDLTSPFNEPVDYIFFIFCSTETPYSLSPSVGGRPLVSVNAQAILDDTNGFYEQLALYGVGFRGTGQAEYERDGILMKTMHELGHTFGFDEGPPGLQYTGYDEDEAAYFYSNLNAMCQHWVDTQATPAYGLHWVNSLDWVETVDFTGENLKGIRLYDLRVFDQTGGVPDPGHPKGNIYKFRQEGSDQYFLMAYRSGMGIDTRESYASGDVILRSHGLEIYHCAGPEDNPYLADLESAFGLYSNISEETLPDDLSVPPNASWGTEDVVYGFDNYDKWIVGEGLRANYSSYIGDEFDFFRIDLPGGETNLWNKDEFSFKTNPNCYWYEPTPHDGRWVRRNAQGVSNSLIIRILEQYDSDDVEFPYMLVDLLSAPYETISIISGASYSVGETIEFTYSETQEWEEYITGFEVYFCPNRNGAPLYFVGSEGIDPFDRSYSFSVADTFGTIAVDGGQVVVKFTNNLSDHTGDEHSAPIFVDADPVIFETLLMPSNGEHLFVGQETRVEWSANFDSSLFTSIEVQYDSGSGWENLIAMSNGDAEWLFDESSGRNYCNVIVPDGMKGPDVSVRMIFLDHLGNLEEEEPILGIKVFPRMVEYSDISLSALANVGDYLGSPAVIVPISQNAAGGKSLVLSLPTNEGQNKGTIFENDQLPNGVSFTERLHSNLFEGHSFDAGSPGIAVADFDGDGDEDFFVCSRDANPSVLFVQNDNGIFNGVTIGSDVGLQTNYAESATWVDFDHDGDLDIFLGRVSTGNPQPNKLFKYDSNFGTFEDVGVQVGLVNPLASSRTSTVCWTDIDGNGYWDVIIGDGNGETLVFREQRLNKFNLVNSVFPDIFVSATSLNVQDLNSDGELDLIVGSSSVSALQVFLQEDGVFTVGNRSSINTPSLSHQVSVGDSDRDGWPDLLVTPKAGDSGFWLYQNFMGKPEYGANFVNVSHPSSFPSLGNARGATLVDFDLDGDFEVFVGMENGTSGGAVWEASEISPDPKWLGVKLISASGASPCGATVYLSDSLGVIGTQVFGSGGNQGGQGTSDLIFGIGESTGPFSVKVKWPSRAASSEPISGNNQYVTICEPNTWLLDLQSPKMEVVVGVDQVDWVFTWETENWTAAEDDWVDFIPTQNCGNLSGGQLVPGSTSGVTTSLQYSSAPETGVATYLHTLTYEDAPCQPGCNITFTVHSGNQTLGTQESDPIVGRFPKLCPVSAGI